LPTTTIPPRDGVAISGERQLRIEGIDKGEVLVFDLA